MMSFQRNTKTSRKRVELFVVFCIGFKVLCLCGYGGLSLFINCILPKYTSLTAQYKSLSFNFLCTRNAGLMISFSTSVHLYGRSLILLPITILLSKFLSRKAIVSFVSVKPIIKFGKKERSNCFLGENNNTVSSCSRCKSL